MPVPDQLVQELQRCEGRLHAWLGLSSANAELFARDPVSALRAAKIGLEESFLDELEVILQVIAMKLSAAPARSCA